MHYSSYGPMYGRVVRITTPTQNAWEDIARIQNEFRKGVKYPNVSGSALMKFYTKEGYSFAYAEHAAEFARELRSIGYETEFVR